MTDVITAGQGVDPDTVGTESAQIFQCSIRNADCVASL